MRIAVLLLAVTAAYCSNLEQAQRAVAYQAFIDRCKTCAAARDEDSESPYLAQEQGRLRSYAAQIAVCASRR